MSRDIRMPKAPGVNFWVARGEEWFSVLTQLTEPKFRYDPNTSAGDPGPNKIRFNNADVSLATEIYINNETIVGMDLEKFLDQVTIGDYFLIGQIGAPTNNAVIRVAGDTTNNTTWHTVPIGVDSAAGAWVDDVVLSVLYNAASRRAKPFRETTTNTTTSGEEIILCENTSNITVTLEASPDDRTQVTIRRGDSARRVDVTDGTDTWRLNRRGTIISWQYVDGGWIVGL